MKTKPSKQREETADRIIAAAGTVFAERGFRNTTIRQITTRAGVNLAAVNYYFRDKSELYIRVLRVAKHGCQQIVVSDLPGDPEEQLRGFIERFVGFLLNPDRPLWQGRLMSMEMANPTPAFGVIIRELIAPLFREVRELVRELAGPQASDAKLDLFTFSIFGQCVYYVTSRAVIEKVAPHLESTVERPSHISDHIAAFSISALHLFRDQAPSKPASHPKGSSHTLALR